MEGSLVEFKKGQRTGLALVTEKDGKRNWRAVDTRCSSMHSRKVGIVSSAIVAVVPAASMTKSMPQHLPG